MSFTQHVMTCPAAVTAGLDVSKIHPGGTDPTCVVIVCTDDTSGAVVWHSHDVNTIDPASRLNPSVTAKDWR